MPKKRRGSGNSPTAREYQILRYIYEYIRDVGYPPTAREIAEWFKMSISGAWYCISSLVQAGLLTHRPRRPRTFILTDEGLRIVGASHGASQQ